MMNKVKRRFYQYFKARRSHRDFKRIVTALMVFVMLFTTAFTHMPEKSLNTEKTVNNEGKEISLKNDENRKGSQNNLESLKISEDEDENFRTSAVKTEDGSTAFTSYEKKTFPRNTELKIEKIRSEDIEVISNIINEEMLSEGEKVINLTGHDFTFINDKKEVQPDGDVYIEFEFSNPPLLTDESSRWKLYHIDEEGYVEDITEKEKNGFILDEETEELIGFFFTSDSFSEYLLAEIGNAEAAEEKNSKADSVLEELERKTLEVMEKSENIEEFEYEEDIKAESELRFDVERMNGDFLRLSSKDIDEDENLELEESIPKSDLTEDVIQLNDLEGISLMNTPLRNNGSGIGTGYNFTPDITSVIVEKLIDRVWVPATEFEDGEEVRVTVNYETAHDKISITNPYMYYQLPDGVVPAETTSGEVIYDGRKVGEYTIYGEGPRKGLIQIKYTDSEFINSPANLVGKVSFTGIVNKITDDEEDEINFGGSSETIKVKKAYDLAIEKTGMISLDRTTASYVIEASTENGTGDTVTITDRLWALHSRGVHYDYDSDSIAIKKVSANGTETVLNVSPTIGTVPSSNDAYFTFTDLPELGAGEKYVVTYNVNVPQELISSSQNESGKIANDAKIESGGGSKEKEHNLEWAKRVKKSGVYNDKTGRVLWQVTINENREDVTGWTFEDIIDESVQGQIYDEYIYVSMEGNPSIKYPVTVTDMGNGKKKLSFTFPNMEPPYNTSKFIISYSTIVPDGATSVTNEATVEEGGKTESDEFTVETDPRKWDLKKNYVKKEVDGNDVTNTWSFNVVLPHGDIEEFTYTDEILNAKNSSGQDLGPDSHYGIASEIEEDMLNRLVLNAEGNTRYKYREDGIVEKTVGFGDPEITDELSFEITYYDDNGNVIPKTDRRKHVKKFTIKVKAKPGETFKGMNMQALAYRTHTNVSSAEDGDVITSVNKGSIPGVEDSAESKFTKNPRVEKEVYVGSSMTGGERYESGTVELDYTNQIKYRVTLGTQASDNGKTLQITDQLPRGASLAEGSIEVKRAGTFSGSLNFSYTVDETGLLTITIPNYSFNARRPKIEIKYAISIEDDSFWDDPSNELKEYINDVHWDEDSASTKTVIKREVETIEKSGEQVQQEVDGEMKPTNRIKYNININPKGEDLDPNSDVLTLTDTMTATGNTEPVLDLSTVKLYHYDGSKEGNKGNIIDPSFYTLEYDVSLAEMTLQIPDELACVLEYEYILDTKFSDNTLIKNSANLNGKFTSDTSISLVQITSDASVTKKMITIYKVDDKNYNKILPGTVFELEYFNQDTGEWLAEDIDSSDKVTNEDGKLEWDLSHINLTSDRLYRLKEIESAEGYSIPPDKYFYFIWTGNHNDKDAAYENSGASHAGPDGTIITRDKINIFSNSGGIMYIPNTYTRLSVEKVWLDNSGQVKSPPADKSIQVQLNRSKRLYQNYKKLEVRLKSSENIPDKVKTIIIDKDTTEMYIRYSSDRELSGSIDEGSGNLTPRGIGWLRLSNLSRTGETVKVTVNHDYRVHPHISFSGYKEADFVLNTEKEGEAVTLNDSNGWKYEWEGLPDKDENGYSLFYTVEEITPVEGHEVSYVNNEGIIQGEIKIINKATGFEMPKTGGNGIRKFILYGAGIMTAAFAFLVITKKN